MYLGKSEDTVLKAASHTTSVFVLIWGLAFNAAALGAPQAGGVQAAGPKVRMVRSVAGTKGETRGGSYVILDPRTTFLRLSSDPGKIRGILDDATLR